MIFQRTIKTPTSLEGIGLHTGKPIRLQLRPAAPGSGITFHRHDGEQVISIKALSENVVDTRMATVLGKDGHRISTVEHLMAAITALGIDNLHIDIDGPEVPVMDGSSAPFLAALDQAGLKRQGAGRQYLTIRKPISLVEGEKRVTIIPSRFFRITFDISFDHPSIALQRRSVKVGPELFRKEIAPARTFGFFEEVEYLKANGLARGGSLENAVVIGKEGVLNPEGLRFRDEFVRHKILDAIGDFSLIGFPILGHIKAYKAGHDINHKMVQKILASPDCWKLVTFSEEELEQEQTAPSALAAHLAFSKN